MAILIIKAAKEVVRQSSIKGEKANRSRRKEKTSTGLSASRPLFMSTVKEKVNFKLFLLTFHSEPKLHL